MKNASQLNLRPSTHITLAVTQINKGKFIFANEGNFFTGSNSHLECLTYICYTDYISTTSSEDS